MGDTERGEPTCNERQTVWDIAAPPGVVQQRNWDQVVGDVVDKVLEGTGLNRYTPIEVLHALIRDGLAYRARPKRYVELMADPEG